MPTFRITFTVEGHGYFPMDMLRYDSCCPVRPDDVDKITYSYDNCEVDEMRSRRSVDLAMIVPTTKANAQRCLDEKRLPTVGRWESFGWKVTKVEMKPANQW